MTKNVDNFYGYVSKDKTGISFVLHHFDDGLCSYIEVIHDPIDGYYRIYSFWSFDTGWEI